MAELIELNLASSGSVTLVERQLLDKLVREKELLSLRDASKLGKLIPAKFLFLGKVRKEGDAWRLKARLVNSLSGKIVLPYKRSFGAANLIEAASEAARLIEVSILRNDSAKATGRKSGATRHAPIRAVVFTASTSKRRNG